ncbi:MAG: 50S ribosomal protein L19 [Flavobacteriales bacterium AspAUS03]
MEILLKYVQEKYIEKKDFPVFNAGDTITVYYEIKEGDKTRTQSLRGVVIQRRGEGATTTFTVRKMSGDIGVERIFVLSQPSIQKIEVNKQGKVRKARIYYFRKLRGKKARIKEKQY